ncbi:MAG: hypothetical protein RLZZ237_4202 [Pseudomonadota bacterium]|jgi:hypothetical protein
MKIVWTDAAQRDLLDIREFLKDTESLQFAIKVTQEIRDEVATLKKWPKHKGSYVKELENSIFPSTVNCLLAKTVLSLSAATMAPATSILCAIPAVTSKPCCAGACSIFELSH